MKVFLLTILTLTAAQSAFAKEKIHVMVDRCTSVKIVNGQFESKSEYLISGSESTKNEKGGLIIKSRKFVVDGEERITLRAEFIATDGTTVSASLANSAGAHAISRTLNCESAADIGKISLMLSYDDSPEEEDLSK